MMPVVERKRKKPMAESGDNADSFYSVDEYLGALRSAATEFPEAPIADLQAQNALLESQIHHLEEPIEQKRQLAEEQ